MVYRKSLILFYVILITTFIFQSIFSYAQSADDYDVRIVTKMLETMDVNNLKARSAILIDASTGGTLFDKNSHEKVSIASITKIMSMLLIMDEIDSKKLKYSDTVTVSEYATSMGGSQAYLKPGEQFTVSDMLKAVAVHSSNDVTVALAEKVAGSETTFVNKMNDKAKKLGMKDTNFMDCTGLTDEGHYSTAYDVALMSRELITKHPDIIKFTSIWHDTFRNGKFALDNTNKLIKYYIGADGLKTGHTTKAGYCLSATAVRNNSRLISVVLGEPDTNTRFAESKKLLDYGFLNFEKYNVHKKGQEMGTIKVIDGTKRQINGVIKDDLNVSVLRFDKDKVKMYKDIQSSVKAPIKKGQKLGEVVYKIGDKVVGKSDLVANHDVKKASFLRMWFRALMERIGIVS